METLGRTEENRTDQLGQPGENTSMTKPAIGKEGQGRRTGWVPEAVTQSRKCMTGWFPPKPHQSDMEISLQMCLHGVCLKSIHMKGQGGK